MGRKIVIDVGAPAYMAQFTALMTLLLAFFILLNVLKEKKEGGFEDGIGQIRNAFGVTGGLGLFSYTFMGKGGAHAPPPVHSDINAEQKQAGFEKDLVRGAGGEGNTDAEVDPEKMAHYLRYKLPITFEKNKTNVGLKMQKSLERLGMAMALFETKFEIRCFALDTEVIEMNRSLASKRAATIMKYFNSTQGVPFERMTATGYGDELYFQKLLSEEGEEQEEAEKQGAYIYIFVKPAKRSE